MTPALAATMAVTSRPCWLPLLLRGKSRPEDSILVRLGAHCGFLRCRLGKRLTWPLCPPRSTSDVGSKTRMAESAGPEPTQLHDSSSFAQVSRGPVSVAQLDQSALNYSGGQEEKSLQKARAGLQPQIHTLPATCGPQESKSLVPSVALASRATAFISLKDLKSDKKLRCGTAKIYF